MGSAAEYAALPSQGLPRQATVTRASEAYRPAAREYVTPMGSSLRAPTAFDQGRTLAPEEYQAPRWVAPSSGIGPERSVTGATDTLSRSTPYATIGFDTNQNGRANFVVSGPDRNLNGIPDYLEGSVASGGIARGPVILGANIPKGIPAATIGFDKNQNGKANFMITGPDLNRNGIPDFLEGAVASRGVVPKAAPLGVTTSVPVQAAAPRARDVYAAITASRANAAVGMGQARVQQYAPQQLQFRR